MDMPLSLKIRFDQALKGYAATIEFDESQCRALEAEFGVLAVHKLKAQITTKSKAGLKPVVAVTIGLSADVSQECGVSLEVFRHPLSHEFCIDCMERQHVTNEVIEIGAKELGLNELEEPDIIEDGQIDLGQYIIESFSEIYDPYARAPGAEFVEPVVEKEPSPFAILARLKTTPSES